MKKTNAAWFADIFKSGNTFELFIVDERSHEIIVRSQVDLAEACSVINLLRGAFRAFGAPADLRTDGATSFASARFGDTMHSCGIAHTISAGTAPEKGLAERLAKT